MGAKKLKVWITKYLFTRGIYEREVRQSEVSDRFVHGPDLFESYHDKAWHKTEVDAVTHAILMCEKKVESLGAQLDHVVGVKSALLARLKQLSVRPKKRPS